MLRRVRTHWIINQKETLSTKSSKQRKKFKQTNINFGLKNICQKIKQTLLQKIYNKIKTKVIIYGFCKAVWEK